MKLAGKLDPRQSFPLVPLPREMFSDKLRHLRQTAISEANKLFRARGFTELGNEWKGSVDGLEDGEISISVRLPKEFPDCTPEIYVERQKLRRRIPHVEKSGKICIVPSTGTLIDARNTHGVVSEALEHARTILIRGLSGAIDDDFYEEFLAYWNPRASEGFLSICNPRGPAREICLVDIDGHWIIIDYKTLIAENLEDARRWVSKLNGTIKTTRKAYFVPLTAPFMPPDFEEIPSTNEILSTISKHATSEIYDAFRAWLNRSLLPTVVILSLPQKIDQGQTLIAVRLQEATGALKMKAIRGFRPSTLPAFRELEFAKQRPAKLIRLARFDPEYLLPRGGSALALTKFTVVIVGCGSVGSHVVERLASLGIGRLRLVDPEHLMPENIHRHALGVKYVGVNKAEGLCTALAERYPHISCEHREKTLQELLEKESGFLTEANALIVAIGDETLELRLNNLLGHQIPRLHTWLDPLGIGGHVLATGISTRPGCYECLFLRDKQYGLFNGASFARAGQNFQKSYAGCAGTFVPFAGIHADRTAIEAASLAARLLLGEETDNVLVSWFGDTGAFIEAGFSLSDRQALFKAGETRKEINFMRLDCPTCR